MEQEKDGFELKCMKFRKELSQCASDNVPEVREVRTRCAVQVNAYDSCVSANPGNPTVCIEALKALYNCTNNSKA